jgi:glycerophosphoryl diester phosphodiesterase
MSENARVVAHRGASRVAPENTLSAIALGYRTGAAAVEIDVHLTRDRHVVVIHDYSTLRTAGVDRKIAEQTLAQISKLDAGSWFAPQFAGESIPTLRDVLTTVPEGRTLFVEIKTMSTAVPAIAEVIDSDPRVAVQSFSQAVLLEMNRVAPGVPTYWLAPSPLDPTTRVHVPLNPVSVALAQRLHCRGIALDARGSSPEVLETAQIAGLETYLWTVDDLDDVARFARMGATWIETNEPSAALEMLTRESAL